MPDLRCGTECEKQGMINQKLRANEAGLDRFAHVILAVVLASAALYFARPVLEPIAFALFGIALVWPFKQALEARLPKAVALVLTVLLAVLVIFVLASAIVWSVDDILHWAFGNIARFQFMYARTT
jgi:AI-2 transport protein TqsA